MLTYCVHTAKMASGDHEVHAADCEWCPPSEDTDAVGEFSSADHAMDAARKLYPEANGCHHCMPKHYIL